MANYRLYYFDVRGRGELIRLIFAYAGEPFDDFRFREINGVSQWFHEYKAKMPFGKAPVLEVDGELLAQSTTIARYLARQFGIAGKTEWDMALADMYIECIADFVVAYTPLYYEKDAGKLKQLEDKFLDETVCPYLEKIEIRLEKNGSGFLVGPELTYADLAHFNYLDFLNERFPDRKLLEGKTHINALLERVGNMESIRKYMASHTKHSV